MVIAAFIFLWIPAPAAWGDGNNLFQQAYTAYLHGRYAEAQADYRKACGENPQNAAAFYGLGLCEYQQGLFSAAEADLRHAAVLDPSLGQAKVLLERVHGRITADQVRDLQFKLLMAQGVMDYRMRQYGQAMDAFGKAGALNPASADLHFNQGLVYMKLGKWDQAEAELEQCLKLDPNDRKAEYALGVLYQELGITAEAQNYFLSVAQSPTAGLYNLEAMRRLSMLHSGTSNSPFHFFLRLQGGGAQNIMENPDPAVPIPNNSAANEYGHLQLTYSPLVGKNILNLSYAGDGFGSQVAGQNPYFIHLHDFSVGSAIPLPSHWVMPLSYDEQIGFTSSGALYYQHHQASAAFQWFFSGPDMVQIQAQYLREVFFPPVNIDTNSWVGSVSTSLVFGAHSLSLSYSLRECLADTWSMDFYSFLLNSLSLVYHVEFGGGWNATLNYTPQWQDYPFFFDANAVPRSDWIQNMSGEFTIPMTSHWNLVVGDQYQRLHSSYSGFSQDSNNYYAATQIFF